MRLVRYSKAEKLLNTAADLYRKDDKEFAESVLQVAMSKNKEIFDIVKEESKMCEALRELMKPEIDAAVEIKVKEKLAEELAKELSKMDDAIAEKDNAIAEKDNVIAEKDNAIAEKDNAIAEKDNAIAEKDKEIQILKAKLAAAGIC